MMSGDRYGEARPGLKLHRQESACATADWAVAGDCGKLAATDGGRLARAAVHLSWI